MQRFRRACLAAALSGALGLIPVPVQAEEKITSSALQELLNSGVSVEELADDITSLLIGRDGRVLKWSAGRPRELTIHVIRSRAQMKSPDPKIKSNVERVEAAGLPDLAQKTAHVIESMTGQNWEVNFAEKRPSQPYKTDIYIIIYKERRQSDVGIVNGFYGSFCTRPSCYRSGTAGSRGTKPLLEDRRRDAAREEPVFEPSRGPVDWFEYANGRGTRVLSGMSFETAHVSASVYASSQREISFSRCLAIQRENPRWLRAEFLECWLRAMGFVGSSELFPQAVLGVRLPEREDYFLNGETAVTGEEYAGKLPNDLHPLDVIALRVLGDSRIQAGMDEQSVKPTVAKILAQIKHTTH
jgi:hypothetical protein